MQVTVQFRGTKKPYAWVSAFRAQVLYADAKVIFIRGAGAESLFHGDGSMIMFRSDPKNPIGARVPRKLGKVRIHPDSVARLQAL